jgi:hypothetical protein
MTSQLPAHQQCSDKVGGADADRTRYLLHAMEALYQLSYSPVRTSEATSGQRSLEIITHPAHGSDRTEGVRQ